MTHTGASARAELADRENATGNGEDSDLEDIPFMSHRCQTLDSLN
jgi:hypothetical protein